MSITITQEELDREIERREADLKAFHQAHALISERLRESELTPGQLLPLHDWSGAAGLKLIMEPLLHAMEKVVSELKAERSNVRGLRLVESPPEE